MQSHTGTRALADCPAYLRYKGVGFLKPFASRAILNIIVRFVLYSVHDHGSYRIDLHHINE